MFSRLDIPARSLIPAQCCSQLFSILGPKVSFPGNESYVGTIESYWSSQEASLTPTCIVIPRTPQDVSTAVSILSFLPDCHFAIKGQAHAPAAGFANIQNGVTIDMTTLNSISVKDNGTIVSVGAGATWLDVYKYLDTLQLSVAGGRNGAVGVAGLTLGGGISYFAPQVGWACDNVVNFEIILPPGELANVNSTSKPDLFRALKGGGNNFGVVTRLDLKTFAQGDILASSVVNSIDDRDAVFEAFSNIAGADPYDPYASIVTSLGFNSTSKVWSLSSTAAYMKLVVNPPVYEELLKIPSASNTLHLTNLSTFAAERAIPQFNWLFFTGTYGVSSSLMSHTFEILNKTLYNFDVPKGIFWSIAFEPLPTLITRFSEDNSLGVSPSDGNAYIMLLSPFWSDTKSNTVVHDIAKKVVDCIAAEAKNMGLLHRFQYINYADPSQHPLQGYGRENFEMMKRVSRKYDAKRVFQTQVSGGFKLGL